MLCRTFCDDEGEGTIFFSTRKWFIINDDIACKTMIKYTKGVELRNMEKDLYKAICT
jgi:hypothetical protein